MIYFPDTIVSWRYLVDCWLGKILEKPYEEYKQNIQYIERLFEEHIKTIMPTFEWLFPPLLNFMKKNCHHIVFVGILHAVK